MSLLPLLWSGIYEEEEAVLVPDVYVRPTGSFQPETEYRIVFYDIVNAIPTGEAFPIQTMSYTKVLNSAGTLECTIPLQTTATFGAGSHSVWVLRNGVSVWSGIIMVTTPNVTDKTITIGAVGWESYLYRRVLNKTVEYFIQDQTSQIANDLIEYAFDLSGESGLPTRINPYPTVNTPASGRIQTLDTIYFFEKRIVGQVLDTVAGVVDGFDYGMLDRWDAGTDEPELEFRTWYPRRGVRLTNRWAYFGNNEAGSNMVPESAAIDASSLSFRVHGAGRGDGYLTPTTVKADFVTGAIYPYYESVATWGDIGLASAISDLTSEELNRVKTPYRVISVALRPDTEDAVPGAFDPGDSVMIYIDEGWWQVNTWYRIISYTVTWNGSYDQVTAELTTDDA